MSLVIDVQNVSKSFYGKKVVNNINLQVEKGDIYGFLGPNGSGKTTTIRMICGLLEVDSGQGTCLGYDIKTQGSLIKQKVGYMTQRFSLYADLTIEENLNFFARLFNVANRKEKVQRIIEQLEIGQARKKQLAGTLSGGWKQRLALGVATIHEPELLLLDEPTAGVDPKARRDFWDEIFRLSQQGITTLVSTHYMDEAERCNKLAYIAYGDLLVSGTCAKVIDLAGLRTWIVRGKNLSQLRVDLAQNNKIVQVSAFGLDLHVSALKNTDINDVLQQNCHYEWQEIKPSLEDVFIHLMQQHQDNFS
ncbi:ABC transporter ATP-binding protein [Cysteiniphilum sp. 6C5]|uniref:ABC transporter ATP-binding protein n=1 Tax=unclassified Cysteiniphilum TaxID=2610889 RepID=UPI003F83B177